MAPILPPVVICVLLEFWKDGLGNLYCKFLIIACCDDEPRLALNQRYLANGR